MLLGKFGTVLEETAAASSTLKMAEAAGSSKMLLQIC
jgi:hypothetical protein